MSAYVVHPTHIDALLTAGLELARPSKLSWWAPGVRDAKTLADRNQYHRELTPATATAVGAMLLTENELSVAHRYHEDPDLSWITDYEFDELPGHAHPLIVLNALTTYEYQACEHPGWHDSEAAEFVAALRHEAIRRLPGIGDYAWGDINDRQVFVKERRPAA